MKTIIDLVPSRKLGMRVQYGTIQPGAPRVFVLQIATETASVEIAMLEPCAELVKTKLSEALTGLTLVHSQPEVPKPAS